MLPELLEIEDEPSKKPHYGDTFTGYSNETTGEKIYISENGTILPNEYASLQSAQK